MRRAQQITALRVGTSMGRATSAEAETTTGLLRLADTRLYAVKRRRQAMVPSVALPGL